MLRKEQQWDQFCKNKVKKLKAKLDSNFLLDDKSILRKVVKLKYSEEPTIVVPRKLTSLIIVEFHNAKGHQGNRCTINMIKCYLWWVGMCRDIHQHVNSCKLYIQFLPNRIYTTPMHMEIPQVPFVWCTMDCIRPLPATSRGNRHALTFFC